MSDTRYTPTTLMEGALWVLATGDADLKAERTHVVGDLWREGKLPIGEREAKAPSIERPPRPDDLVFISPGKAPKMGKPGSEKYRVGILHALANVEQWAIDTAWDNIVRFSHHGPVPEVRAECPLIKVDVDKNIDGGLAGDWAGSEGVETLPREYFDDMVRMACEEAKHYGWFRDRLVELGSHYGALPVHGSIWESVQETAHALLCRLVIVHMVQEARGLDVNPNTIANFTKCGDVQTAAMLELVHADEITHVSTGARWFRWECERLGLDPGVEFARAVRKHFHGALKSPFNNKDRLAAGMEESWYLPLGVVRNREMGAARVLTGE